MHLTVGYPVTEREAFVDAVRKHRDAIDEVYFPWPGTPSGRMSISERQGYILWDAQEKLEDDLRAFRAQGLKLDLLLNANCLGDQAVSRRLQRQTASILDRLQEVAGGADAVTTASPFIAHVVKQHAPAVRVRASVNMRIGCIEAMEQMADLFDGYCVQREHNRDRDYLRRLRAWADAEGKELVMLANSGCLNFCANQVFHDNLVAHEADLSAQDNLPDFNPIRCRAYLAADGHAAALLADSNWVRPEAIRLYDGCIHLVKLATRMHQRADVVIGAYASGTYRGNLLDLLEPNLASLFHPRILDNARLSSEALETMARCPDTEARRAMARAALAQAWVSVTNKRNTAWN